MATHHSTSSKQLFQIGSFLAVFRVPNFQGRFEVLNKVFLGIAWARRAINLIFFECTPRQDLSNGLSNDPNGDRMQKLCPGKLGYQFTTLG